MGSICGASGIKNEVLLVAWDPLSPPAPASWATRNLKTVGSVDFATHRSQPPHHAAQTRRSLCAALAGDCCRRDARDQAGKRRCVFMAIIFNWKHCSAANPSRSSPNCLARTRRGETTLPNFLAHCPQAFKTLGDSGFISSLHCVR
jgi:hypothetical protein